jgi:hypothetical protein
MQSERDFDDDKYSKAAKKSQSAESGALSKYSSALELASSVDAKQLLQNRYTVYMSLLFVGSVVYLELGGSFLHADKDDLMQWTSALAEAFGLLTLGRRIKMQKSAAGISGHSFLMYCIVYAFRQALLVPAFSWAALDGWVTEILLSGSLIMVLDVTWSVFKTHRDTYQSDLDVLHVKFLVPACFVLAALLRPVLTLETPMYAYFWSSCLYLDVLALMPQVVLMGRSGGKVKACSCNFVAVTAFSRMVDLVAWYSEERNDLVTPFSKVLIIFFHILHLLLVADFMFYYIKARFTGKSFSDDIELSSEV